MATFIINKFIIPFKKSQTGYLIADIILNQLYVSYCLEKVLFPLVWDTSHLNHKIKTKWNEPIRIKPQVNANVKLQYPIYRIVQ